MKFKEIKLEEVCTIQRGASPRPIKDFIVSDGVPWVKIADATADSSRYISKTKEFIKHEGVMKSRPVVKGDLILSNSATPGLPKIMMIDACIHDGWLLLREFKGISKEFLYYVLVNKRRELVSNATGTVFNNLKTDTVKNFKIQIPPMDTQKKVVSYLGTIDEKIDLNRKIISNLEELAQTLFKHWFVDFEFPNEEGKPYKSSGGKMVESELGVIPEGWGIGNLNYFIHETMNGDWGKAEAEKNHQFPVNIIRGADLPELRFGRDGKPPKRFILEKNFKKKSLRNGDVIVEISGGSPTQSTGRTLFVDQNILKKFDNKVVSTNFCRVLRPSIEEHGIFVHTYFAYLYNNGVFFNYENGTTGIKNLDIKSVLEELKVVIPDETILNKFNSLVYILLNSIQKLGDENSKLEAIRDTLLPKLLSGEIELPDDMEVTDDVPIS